MPVGKAKKGARRELTFTTEEVKERIFASIMKPSPFKSDQHRSIYEKQYDTWAKNWPVQSDCVTIQTTYGVSYVRISGRANTKTIVLLPPAASTSLGWSNIVGDLVAIGYRVVAIDNIHEFGRSYYTTRISKTSELVDWLDQTLMHLNITNHIELMGLSFGAWHCAQYGLTHLSKIHRITLLAPFMTIAWPQIGIYPRLALCVIPSLFLRRYFASWVLNNAFQKNSTTRNIVERWVEELDYGFRCFKFPRPAKLNLITAEQLKKLESKTGIFLGMRDRAIHSQRIIDALRVTGYQGKMVVLDDAGHDLTSTHSSQIIDILRHD